MRTFNSAANTITVSFDTITKGIERSAHSLSNVIDAVDTSISTVNDLAYIAKSWSDDLRWEQQRNKEAKERTANADGKEINCRELCFYFANKSG